MKKSILIVLTVNLFSCKTTNTSNIQNLGTETPIFKGDPASMVPELTEEERNLVLETHNKARTEVRVTPLQWSQSAAEFARTWAKTLGQKECDMEHSPFSMRGPYRLGENLYYTEGFGAKPDDKASDVVQSWIDEIKYFDLHTARCKEDWRVCGHYTQVVWHSTTHVGCAKVECNDGFKILWTCNYFPLGNINLDDSNTRAFPSF